jgi:hypothetical protein
VIPTCKGPKERSTVALLCTIELLPSATRTVTGELKGVVGRDSSDINLSLTKLALAPLSNNTLTGLPARCPSNSIQVEDKSGVSTIRLLFKCTKESKHVSGKGFSLTVSKHECTENINKGKPELENRGGELPLAVGNPSCSRIGAENRKSP